ncbi:MAG: uroporphyrinogen-III synthase [Candidatus Thermoplasmatota archaeon]|nr:uroporphyrinogen-III synthase [Candidatus Thermoplasmatota archaeon]MCL5438148.1 uroporphyrinogen-III synthase [Candidatus Thermoplasmatota archaeon]
MRNILVTTRPAEKYREIRSKLFRIVNVPLTEMQNSFSREKQDDLIGFDPEVIVFTSETGVRILAGSVPGFLDMRKIVAIGNATSLALGEIGITSFVPHEKDSMGIAALIIKEFPEKKRIALLRSNRPRPELEVELRRAGHITLNVTLYDISESEEISMPSRTEIFGYLVTSPFEADILLERYGIQPDARYFAIGKSTAMELSRIGVEVSKPVGNSNFADTIKKIEASFQTAQ